MADIANNDREKQHYENLRKPTESKLGRSAKQVDDDLQAFKADILKRLAALEKPAVPVAIQK